MSKWIVIGISGATCSGKTTLATNLHKHFSLSVIMSQDDYFFPVDSPNHVKVESLGHINWEIITAINMESMKSDLWDLLSQDPSSAVLPGKAKRSEIKAGGTLESYPHILILEGFLLFSDSDIFNLCNLHFYLTLTREQCWDRRCARTYDPPDIPGYFDQVVWPEYIKHRDEVLQKRNVKVISGMDSDRAIVQDVLHHISIYQIGC